MFVSLLALLLAAAPETSSVEGMQPVPSVPSLVASGLPPLPAELRARTGQYLNARAAALADVSEDGGTLLISTRFASTSQLHVVETPLGMRTQITFGDEPVTRARFQPGDPQTVWYLQDKGGGEFFQLFRLDRHSGRSELLTDGKSRHGDLTLSRDGKRLAFSGTQRNGKDTDVYVAETASPKDARRVTTAEGTWAPLEFSPDGRRLLVAQERSIQDADLYALEVESGKLTRLTPQEGKASVAAAHFTADGKGIYLVTDRWSNFNQLYLLDAKGTRTPLSADVKWNVEDLAVADDGSRIAFAVNEDGASRLYVRNRQGHTDAIALPGERGDLEPGVSPPARRSAGGDVPDRDAARGRLPAPAARDAARALDPVGGGRPRSGRLRGCAARAVSRGRWRRDHAGVPLQAARGRRGSSRWW